MFLPFLALFAMMAETLSTGSHVEGVLSPFQGKWTKKKPWFLSDFDFFKSKFFRKTSPFLVPFNWSILISEDNQTSILQMEGLRPLVGLLQGAAFEAKEPALLLLLALSLPQHEQQETEFLLIPGWWNQKDF